MKHVYILLVRRGDVDSDLEVRLVTLLLPVLLLLQPGHKGVDQERAEHQHQGQGQVRQEHKENIL